MISPLVLLWLFIAMAPSHAADVTAESEPVATGAEHVAVDPAERLYHKSRLGGIIAPEVFSAAYESLVSRGISTTRGTLAIADMSQPSTARRLVLIDLASHDVVLQTLVAHGQGTGGLMAESFSNRHESHQTSLGLYRVGEAIRSPKHGPALLLHGLDVGVNDQARAREIIIHGADYVSARFIAQTGRLGRSWGCPAVPRADMAVVIDALANGGLLFIHGV